MVAVQTPARSSKRSSWLARAAPIVLIPAALAGGFAAGKAWQERSNARQVNAALFEADLSLRGILHEVPKQLVRQGELSTSEGKTFSDLLAYLEKCAGKSFKLEEQQIVLDVIKENEVKSRTVNDAGKRLRFLAESYAKEERGRPFRFLAAHPGGESLAYRIWSGRKPSPPRQQPPARRYKPQPLPPHYRQGRA